jgi:hypothetical protein
MDQWLRSSSLSKQSTATTTISTDVIGIVTEYQHFTSPSVLAALKLQKVVQITSVMNPICFLCFVDHASRYMCVIKPT